MNNRLKKIYVPIIGLGLLFSSCKKDFFYDGINNDPNKITEDKLLPSVLLNGAEMSIGYTVGGDISRYTSVYVQSVRGAARQFAGYDNYLFANQDFDNVWLNCYTQGLNNLELLRKMSDAKGYNYYSGISRVLMAYQYGIITDMWGNIPLTNALKGTNNVTQPNFDSQQAIYTSLQTILDSAIVKLSATSAGALKPGADDVIFGGSAANWKRMANALKARYYLHLSKRDAANYADKVLAVVDNALTGFSDAVVPFYTVETSSNPWYQYYRDRGDVTLVGSYVADKMTLLADPRLSKFIDVTNDVLADHFAAANAHVTLISNTELLFIKAEALSQKNDPTAATVYESAIQSSFAEVGLIPSATYLTTNALTGVDHTARLSQIIEQKNLALFTQPEVFNDWRRTDKPSLTPTIGATIPRRFLYPQTELSYNGANVPTGTTLFSKVWWDL